MRLIDEATGSNGIVSLLEARNIAIARSLDLVEVVPTAQPPVVKILDYGKFLYQLKKEDKKTKAKSKTSEMKEVRISLRISDHDLQVKIERAKRFLAAGDRVKGNLRFRGRENSHKDLGVARMKDLIKALGENIVVEQPPTVLGNTLFTIIRPK